MKLELINQSIGAMIVVRGEIGWVVREDSAYMHDNSRQRMSDATLLLLMSRGSEGSRA